MTAALAEQKKRIHTVESIVARINELGVHMSVVDGRLVLEGNLSQLSSGEREDIRRLKAA